MFQFKSDSYKTNLILKITSVFWIFTKLFSYNLWHTERLFPLIPPFDFLENIPNFIHLALFFLALAGIAFIGFFPRNKFILGITIIVEITSCMLDQNRWQPWEYQYLLTFLFHFFYFKNQKQFVNYFSFLLIVIYLNSGLHKLNGSFLYVVWEKMILIKFFGLNFNQINNTYIHFAGLLLGLIEVLSAFGCLFFKNKKIFALLLVGMHLFILVLVSPIGVNYNSIILPWNVLMIFLILIVFYNNDSKLSFNNLIIGFNKIPFLILGILPFFCFMGLYDNFFSFNLYSGSLKYLRICVDENKISPEYKPYFAKNKSNCVTKKVISGNDWSLKEMNVVIYPEVRFYKGIIKNWKEKNPDSDAQFYIYQYPFGPENFVEYK